jgi:zeaxanthin epoxidase
LTTSLDVATTTTTTIASAPTYSLDSLSSNDDITPSDPLVVLIAGAGVGGLALAMSLTKNPNMRVTVLEQTSQFKRFGGPIQLASNAMQLIQQMDSAIYKQVVDKFTTTGDKTNGIKDGIRTEWYAKFDLASPAADRNMPYTGVIDRPDLQEIYLQSLPPGTVQNGNAVASYEVLPSGQVRATLNNQQQVYGDVLIGADGIWSNVRATMRNCDKRDGATYSGYTVFAGELAYDSADAGQVGYKVYIGPGQYFVITDIGNGNYQWYAFLARPAGSANNQDKPDGTSVYLQGIFEGWSEEIHHILRATQEDEIEQRDLYDRPPSVLKPWTDGRVALLGDAVHAMMPNCQ